MSNFNNNSNGQNNGRPLLLSGGRLLDSASGVDGAFDILLKNGSIEAIDKPGSFSSVEGAEEIDVKGQLVVPGLIDIHVHLREPGEEWKETVDTGCRSAVAGGFTAVCCMPNTRPTNDTASVTELILEQARASGKCRVYPIGAISKNRESKALAPMVELKDAGCVAFSDDGSPVTDSAVMRRALEYSRMLDCVLTCHEEDLRLSDGFSMNESALSLKLGLRGMPDAAENVMISRDIELARLTKGKVHFCHVSTARGVTLIERAKNDGISVTAEVLPHHFLLNESAVGDFDTQAKMSMPLRSEEDQEALLDGLRRGVIDCIASDHAPHEKDSKDVEFSAASFGIIGLQTMLPLTLAKVRDGSLTLERAIDALSTAPARCLNMEPTALKAGAAADITVIDLDRKMQFNEAVNRSKSSNTPFMNWELQGVATKTFVGGRQVFDISELEQGVS